MTGPLLRVGPPRSRHRSRPSPGGDQCRVVRRRHAGPGATDVLRAPGRWRSLRTGSRIAVGQLPGTEDPREAFIAIHGSRSPSFETGGLDIAGLEDAYGGVAAEGIGRLLGHRAGARTRIRAPQVAPRRGLRRTRRPRTAAGAGTAPAALVLAPSARRIRRVSSDASGSERLDDATSSSSLVAPVAVTTNRMHTGSRLCCSTWASSAASLNSAPNGASSAERCCGSVGNSATRRFEAATIEPNGNGRSGPFPAGTCSTSWVASMAAATASSP